MRTFLPKSHYLPDGANYRPLYRWHKEDPWTLVPGRQAFATAGQAIAAADDYLARGLNPKPRCERVEPANDDPLGIEQWHDQRAGRAAREQERALKAIIVRGRQIPVERRRA